MLPEPLTRPGNQSVTWDLHASGYFAPGPEGAPARYSPGPLVPPGRYTVRLTVSNAQGTDTTTRSLTVVPRDLCTLTCTATAPSIALKDEPATPFRVPRAIELIPIDAKSGKRGIFGQPGVILEAFKPGTAPPDAYAAVDPDGRQIYYQQQQPPPDADRNFFRSGTGGLY